MGSLVQGLGSLTLQPGQGRQAPFLRFPHELLNRICLEIQDQPFSEKTLACLARTCKRLYGVANIFLYSKIGIIDEREVRNEHGPAAFLHGSPLDSTRLLRTLLQRPDLASLVKIVDFGSFFEINPDQGMIGGFPIGSYGQLDTLELRRNHLRAMKPINPAQQAGPTDPPDFTIALLLRLMHNVSHVSLYVNETWDLDILPPPDSDPDPEWRNMQGLYIASRPCTHDNFRPPSGFGLQRALRLLSLMPKLQRLTLHYFHYNPLGGQIEFGNLRYLSILRCDLTKADLFKLAKSCDKLVEFAHSDTLYDPWDVSFSLWEALEAVRPSASSLRKLVLLDRFRVGEWLDVLPKLRNDEFLALKELIVFQPNDHPLYDDYPLVALVKKFPNLEHLTISDIGRARPDVLTSLAESAKAGAFPCLQTIRLTGFFLEHAPDNLTYESQHFLDTWLNFVTIFHYIGRFDRIFSEYGIRFMTRPRLKEGIRMVPISNAEESDHAYLSDPRKPDPVPRIIEEVEARLGVRLGPEHNFKRERPLRIAEDGDAWTWVMPPTLESD